MAKPRLSFEFFPPKSDGGRETLKHTRQELKALNPEFFSVTYGAGGSTRDNTIKTVTEMRRDGYSVAPHLSFGSDNERTMMSMIQQYHATGINRIVALRGDVPSGHGGQRLVYAAELVKFIRRVAADHFHIEVAAYPEIHPDAPNYDTDIVFLKQKLDAGADSAITQYFYNADGYFHFVDACRKIGITKPIYPGIMPITNYENLARFSRGCGAEIPRWMMRRLESYGTDQRSVIQFGIDFVTRFCKHLLDGGAPGLHFYTMNHVEPTRTICQQLGFGK